jgi:hypothetical protein
MQGSADVIVALVVVLVACDASSYGDASAARDGVTTRSSNGTSPMTLVAEFAELERLFDAASIDLVVANVEHKVVETSACEVTTEPQCMRCELAPLTAVLPHELARSLRVAPVSFLKRAGLKRVLLCEKLTYVGNHGAAPLGSVDYGRGALLVQRVALGQVARGVIQHELYHLFDIELATRDRGWQALNPEGFRYGRESPSGFARPYGMTNAAEDKATVYEAIITGDLCRLATGDRVLLAKGRLVRQRIRAAIGDDAKFLDELAPCLTREGGT